MAYEMKMRISSWIVGEHEQQGETMLPCMIPMSVTNDRILEVQLLETIR